MKPRQPPSRRASPCIGRLLSRVLILAQMDGGGGVEGWNDASETFNVTLELVRRGYTEEEIVAMWGGNLMRVMDEVAAVAEQIQAESQAEIED